MTLSLNNQYNVIVAPRAGTYDMNGVNMRVPIGYKFILGFIAVVAAAAFAPGIVDKFDLPEWLREPLSFLTAIVIGLLIGSFFTKSFTRRLNNLTEAARRISEGDLTAMTGHDADIQWFIDETSDLKDAVQLMSENLRALVEHMQAAVGNLALSHEAYGSVVTKGQASSKDVIAGASSIFSGALAQANHIGEAHETVMSMTKLADDMADKVTETASASAKVNSMVQRGATTATSAIEKMESMFKGIENTEGAAWRLKDKLNDIPKILDVITHISRQTDLLALNATIEASKAGEHGKGFAMVAEEFRRFADNTNDSVRDVSSIVKELKMEVERVVQTATEGASYLKAGRDDLRKIREILADITTYTSDVAEKASFILALTQKQKDKAGETAAKMEDVAKIARENVTTTEEMENAVEKHGAAINETIAASQKLKELSEELKTVAAKFYLG